MRGLFLVLLLCCSSILFAQSTVVDSLENTLKSGVASETMRVDLLNELSEQYLGNDTVKFTSTREKAVTLSQQIDYFEGYFKAELLLAIYHQKIGAYEKAIQICEALLNESEERDYLKGRIQSLNQIGDLYNKVGQFDEALDNCRKALRLAKRESDPETMASIYNSIGISYYRLGQLDSAIQYYEANLSLRKQGTDSLGVAAAYVNLGGLYYTKGNFKKAISYFEPATAIAQVLKNPSYEAAALNNMGISNWRLGNYDAATENFEQSLALARQMNNKPTMAFCYANMGIIAMERANYPTALDHYLKAAEIRREINDSSGLGLSYHNIGLLFKEWEEDSTAFHYYQRALEIRKAIGDIGGLVSTYNGMGELYLQEGNYEQAKSALEKSIALNEQVGNKTRAIEAYLSMGTMYLKTSLLDSARYYLDKGLSISKEIESGTLIADITYELAKYYMEKGDFVMAREQLLQSLAYASENGLRELESDCYELLSQVYTRLNNYKAAHEALEEHLNIQDSIMNKEIIRKTSRIEAQYAFQKEKDSLAFARQREQIAFEAEISQEKTIRQWTTVVLIMSVLAIAVLAYLIYDKLRKNAVLKKQKEDLDQALTVNNRFFSIISHDLRGFVLEFMGISGIMQYHTQKKNFAELNTLSDKMKRSSQNTLHLLDNLLHWSLGKEYRFPLKKVVIDVNELLVELIELYQPTADNKQINIEYESEPEIYIKGDENGIKTIFRNIVNNALKFTEAKKSIMISAFAQKGEVHIVIRDEGMGMSAEKLAELEALRATPIRGTKNEKGVGLGMRLVMEFVQRNNGKVSIESNEGVSTVFKVSFKQESLHKETNNE